MPIHVQSATEDHSVRFHQYHLTDQSRVRVRKVCEIEDREVYGDEIGKGYEITKDRIIRVSDEELRQMPLPTAKAIEIEAFVPASSIDPVQVGDGYYLQPDGQVAAKPYTLLRMALERSAKVAVAKYAWSGRERLGLLRVRDDVIVLHQMLWPDEIRDPAQLAPDPVELTEEEIDEAALLIDRMELKDLDGFRDRYTDALNSLLAAKREGHALPEAPEPEQAPGQVVDLMDALQASVARARASRGEDTEADVHEMPKPGKKTAAKKASKTSAKKPAAKKTAGRKPKRTA